MMAAINKQASWLKLAFIGLLTTISVWIVMNHSVLMNSGGGWSRFKGEMESFFKYGLGGPGMQGVGIAIMVIGIVMAVVSFVVHRINPQSRMPGPLVSLFIAVVGSVLMSGIERPLKFIEKIRDILFGWIGI